MKHSDLVYLTVNDSPTNDRTTSTVSSPRPVGAEEMEGVEEMKHNVEVSGGGAFPPSA